ncbi:MAG: hypothetical protein K2M94_04530 [Paramuribaculum sp.]|nr:hypothetical protein [Paramuribaculum sp.]
MKKIYFLAVSAALALSSTAADFTFSANRNVNGLTSPAVSNASETTVLKAVDSQLLTYTSDISVKATTATDEESWTSIGTGTWVEGPLDMFSDIKSGVTHELEIFQSDSNPNIYRMIPYGEGSELATLLGRANTNYFYVDVTTADKVLGYGDYTDKHIMFFNSFEVTQNVPEGGFNGTEYGVYDDAAKTVSFPVNGFGLKTGGSWYYSNVDGKFMIYFPGAAVKDYSFSSHADLCRDDNIINFSVTAGADIADIKAVIMDGNYTASTEVLAYAATNGQSITRDKNYTFTDEEAGVYTIILAALDSEGNVKDGATHWVQILDDNDSDWKEVGAGVYSDPILKDAGYLSVVRDYDVTVQRSESNPNRLRFKSPFGEVFANYNVSHTGHEHYIYIDITDPEAVVVELSLSGLAVSYGQIRVWSVNGRYSGNTADELKGYGYGISTYDEATNTITFPAKSLFYQEAEYANGSWFTVQNEGKLVLPNLDNLGAIGTVEADNIGGVEYYNLQGIRVAEPEKGIFLMRQGGKATKVLK